MTVLLLVCAVQARAAVTSIVFNKDIICRLSMRSLVALRRAMHRAFQASRLRSKFDILRHSVEGRYKDMLHDEQWSASRCAADADAAWRLRVV
jgi:hypothetical protein